MPFSVMTTMWLGEHRALVVKFFIKTEHYVAGQHAFCKKFKLRRHDSVRSRVTILANG